MVNFRSLALVALLASSAHAFTAPQPQAAARVKSSLVCCSLSRRGDCASESPLEWMGLVTLHLTLLLLLTLPSK